tara:strand:+ start:125 stop:493 length:369 start_codon:yes stop_codon:yes gene_type:complete
MYKFLTLNVENFTKTYLDQNGLETPTVALDIKKCNDILLSEPVKGLIIFLQEYGSRSKNYHEINQNFNNFLRKESLNIIYGINNQPESKETVIGESQFMIEVNNEDVVSSDQELKFSRVAVI